MAPQPFCFLPFSNLRVDCEGEVFMCLFQREGSVGNILKEPFHKIWFGDAANDIREATLDGRLHSSCHNNGCPHLHEGELPSSDYRGKWYPSSLEIDLPNFHCNIGGTQPTEKNPACLMCDRNRADYRFHQEDRLPQVLSKLLFVLPYLKQIHIQGISEAFWKDYIFKVLDLLSFDQYAEKIKVSTTTNGTIFDEQRQARFLERCPVSAVTFSLDASTPETYRKIRRLDAFEKVVSNLSEFGKRRKKYSGSQLKIQNNLNLLNLSEALGMLQIGARVEADVVDFYPTRGHPAEILIDRRNQEQFLSMQESLKNEAKNLGIAITFSLPLSPSLANRI